ncbi:MAG: aspartate-semialdehyde dehydrogenase [Pseudobdellovibrionaceae bacterium]
MSPFSHIEKIQSLAVVGATGLVGQEFLSLLEEYKLKVKNLKLIASHSSVGSTVEVFGETLRVEALTGQAFEGVEAAFFSIPTEETKKYVPLATKAGCLVVDDSSVHRMDPQVPLVLAQLNGKLLKDFKGKIISVPNCTTTPLVYCLKPLHEEFGLKRVVVSTYQAVSGAGKAATDELSSQTAALLNAMEAEIHEFPHRIAFNILPKIGKVLDNENTEEEEKVIRETRKILGLPHLKVSSTAVRVPTFFGHGLSVNVEFENEVASMETIREMLDKAPGVQVIDKPAAELYPTNVEATGSNEVFVGRVRRDPSVKSGINFWCIADNIRRGAALIALETLDTYAQYRGHH